MKKMKVLIAGGAAVLTLTATSLSAFAASTYQTPAEVAAGVTDQTLESVIAERQSGQSYGSIAAKSGKLSEFKESVLELRQENLDAKVSDGTLTQEEADSTLNEIAQRQEACDGSGTGYGRTHDGQRLGDGLRNGNGKGSRGMNRGFGQEDGSGLGLRDGSCQEQ